ncbi:hypothetical protein QA601_05570 [Chitinispirillales bacterium ANBcel5]|uniref:hypothetical protein n=1 Tax=Cellulosispirillum alkaliphilum TaxID=3039283 RepID=UPI002A565C71|nr:hypothetical protein [Chitinispirillales bacterium ANBcel5]
MYENPLYRTPDGLKRFKKNPSARKNISKQGGNFDKNNIQPSSSLDQFIVKNRKAISSLSPPKKQISEKSAKIIALALKSMLGNNNQ